MTRRTVQLAYGRNGLAIEVPAERTTVVTPTHRQAAPDPGETLRTALRAPVAGPPLHDVLAPGQTVAISVCDVTRPQPRRPMLEAILEQCDGIIRREDVVILVATGTHRASSSDERIAMFGQDIVEGFRIVDHDARDRGSLVDLGMVGDVPLLLNREWVEADVRLTTGFVEPHFFAGFSGGPKMVAPGLAGLDTVLALHDARRIGDSRATFGIVDGNPVHDAVRAIAAATGVHFALDVLLNDEQRITRAFGGELFAMHAAAREAARAEAMQPVERPFDITVTTNSGYPLDQNLYQAVKGMAAAALVTRPGGPIICAAACEDGLPDHGSYARLLASASTPQGLLDMIAALPETVPDQWQVQVQARIQVEHEVFVHADGLADAAIRAAHFTPSDDVTETLEGLVRDDPAATIGVLPEGPQTIAYVA